MKTKKASKTTHPVPAFVDDRLVEKLESMPIPDRISEAERLEKIAAQLRCFKQKPVPYVTQVNFNIRPEQKRALLEFARLFGTKDLNELDKLNCAARWFLDEALTMFRTIVDRSHSEVYYRDAEDLEESVYNEKRTAIELAEYKKEQAKLEDSDDED